MSHPSQCGAIYGDNGRMSQSASVGAALHERDAKTRKLKMQYDARGVWFQALATCTVGGLLQEDEEIVKELAAQAALRGGGDHGIITPHMWQCLSLAQRCHYACLRCFFLCMFGSGCYFLLGGTQHRIQCADRATDRTTLTTFQSLSPREKQKQTPQLQHRPRPSSG